jgi:hypothetical protein
MKATKIVGIAVAVAAAAAFGGSVVDDAVFKLDLRGGGCNGSDYTQVLGGNISSSLLGLQHLQYLSLGCKPEMGSMGCKYQGSWVLSTS